MYLLYAELFWIELYVYWLKGLTLLLMLLLLFFCVHLCNCSIENVVSGISKCLKITIWQVYVPKPKTLFSGSHLWHLLTFLLILAYSMKNACYAQVDV